MVYKQSLKESCLVHTLNSPSIWINSDMSFFAEAPPPPTALGRYRALSKHASIHVSPLILGAQSIGDQWHAIGMGAMDKDSSFKLLDAYYEAGGNFIDTANN